MNCQGGNCRLKLAIFYCQYCSFLIVIFNLLRELDFDTYSKNCSNKHFYKNMRSGEVFVALTSSAFSLPSRNLQRILIDTIKGGAIRALDNMTPDDVYWNTTPKLKEAI
jgi:hypothetical protein